MEAKQEVDATVQVFLAYLWTYGPSKQWDHYILWFVDCASRYNSVNTNNLTHNLSLVYSVNLCIFWAYLSPSSGGTTYVYKIWYLLFFLGECLLSWLDWNIVPIQPGQQTII